MNAHKLMKDPFYAQLVYCIESAISEADKHARSMEIRLTDSNIKSALNKARKFKPEPPETNEPPQSDLRTKDEVIAELIRSLAGLHTLLESEGEEGDVAPVSEADVKKGIAAVEASLKIHKSPEPGSRYYLDYVKDFLEKARSE